MRHQLRRAASGAAAVLFLLMVTATFAGAQRPAAEPSKAEAKAKYQQAKQALKDKQFEQAAAGLREVLEIEPEFVNAHNEYWGAVRSGALEQWKKDNPEKAKELEEAKGSKRRTLLNEPAEKASVVLREQYDQWLAKYPGKAPYYWARGFIYNASDHDVKKAEEFYRKSIEIDPKFIRGYQALVELAEKSGDADAKRNWLKKALDQNPGNIQVALDYALGFRYSDPVEFRRQTDALLKKFSSEPSVVPLLAAVAADTDDPNESRKTLEKIRKQFGSTPGAPIVSSMKDLFNIYAESKPKKALALARQMAAVNPKLAQWQTLGDFQDNLLQAQALVKKKKFEDAQALLEKVKPPSGIDTTELILAKAAATSGKGEREKAYESLLASVAKQPNQKIEMALRNYGRELGRAPGQVTEQLWKARVANAPTFKEFELARYSDGQKVRLADYRGKVVLVNFWFPG